MAVTIDIRPARFPLERDLVRRLFREYAGGLGVDLGFQHFDEELEGLPGSYAGPRGRLLLADDGTHVLGCVALRPLTADTCEMKRLYVRSEARGHHLGRRLVERICDEARVAGYARICLDTLPTMSAAWLLYRSLGFEAIAPYNVNPVAGVQYLGLDLSMDAAPR